MTPKRSGKRLAFRKSGTFLSFCAVLVIRLLPPSDSEVLPALLTWRGLQAWLAEKDAESEALATADVLRSLPNVGIAGLLRRMASALNELLLLDREAIRSVVHEVSHHDLENSTDRVELAETIRTMAETWSQSQPFGEHLEPWFVSLIARFAPPEPSITVFDSWSRRGDVLAEIADLRCRRKLPPPRFVVRTSDPDSFCVALAQWLLLDVREIAARPAVPLERMLAEPSNDLANFIVAIPPFGGRLPKEVSLPVPTRAIELALLQDALRRLAPGGTAIVVVPGALIQRASEWPQVLDAITRVAALEQVLALPRAPIVGADAAQFDVLVLRGTSSAKDTQTVRLADLTIQPVRELANRVTHVEHSVRIAETIALGGWSLTIAELKQDPLATHPDLRARTAQHELDEAVQCFKAAPWNIEIRSLGQMASITEPSVEAAREERSPTSVSLWVEGGTFHASVNDGSAEAPRSAHVWNLTPREVNFEGMPIGNNFFEVFSTTRLKVSAAFLARWLGEPEVREFLIASLLPRSPDSLMARLLTLPVPVPSTHLQSEAVHRGGSLLGWVRTLRRDADRDPITDWLIDGRTWQELLRLRKALSREVPGSVLALADTWDRALDELRVLGEGDLAAEDTVWWHFLEGVGATLRALLEVPDGTARTLITVGVARSFENAAAFPANSHPSDWSVRRKLEEELKLFANCMGLLEPPLDDIEITVVATEAPTPLLARVTLRNDGPAGVYANRIEVDHGASWSIEPIAAFVWWGVREEVGISIPYTIDACTRTLRWTGFSLRNEPLVREIEVQIPVPSDAQPIDLGENPYIVGTPVEDASMFFGREALLHEIDGILNAGRTRVIVLEGRRRSGKTSIQFQIRARSPAGRVVVRSDLQRIQTSVGGHWDSTDLWRLLAQDVLLACHRAGVSAECLPTVPHGKRIEYLLRTHVEGLIPRERPFGAFGDLAATVLAALAPRRLVLIVDEVDKLIEAIDHGLVEPATLEQLRALVQGEAGLSLIVSGTGGVTHARRDRSSPLFGMGRVVHVGNLDESAAQALVTEPVTGRLSWEPDAVEWAVDVTAAEPFVLQTLCSEVFASAVERRTDVVDRSMVEHVARAAARDNEHLRAFWTDVANPHHRLVLCACAVASLSSGYRAADLGTIEARLAERGVPSVERFVAPALEALQAEELVELTLAEGLQRYRLRPPLFAHWITQNHGLDALARGLSSSHGEAP